MNFVQHPNFPTALIRPADAKSSQEGLAAPAGATKSGLLSGAVDAIPNPSIFIPRACSALTILNPPALKRVPWGSEPPSSREPLILYRGYTASRPL